MAPKNHRYLVDIPTDIWQKSQQKARTQELSMRAYLVKLLRKDLALEEPSLMVRELLRDPQFRAEMQQLMRQTLAELNEAVQ